MTEHTPKPWKSGDYDSGAGYDCMTGGFEIFDAKGNLVITIDQAIFGQPSNGSDEREYSEAKELAAFIVKCVNHHDELVTALENLANAADFVGVHHFDTDSMDADVEDMQNATEQARAILARMQA